MLVGGSVRDQLVGIESKDLDVEVYGLDAPHLRTVLELLGPVNAVGDHFAVYKLGFHQPAAEQPGASNERFEIDVSLPRRESRSGRGHRGFVIEGDPSMTFEEAARRRDFTLNAILHDPLTGETVDPFGGIQDLERRVLSAVAADTFIEDSLRVLRAVQLSARFEATIDPWTIELCRGIDLSDLPRERIWAEIEKLLTLAKRPSIGLQVALDLGVLDQLFPEIRALVDCRPKGESHSEYDLFYLTKRSLDEAINLVTGMSNSRRLSVMLATLCSGMGDACAVSPGDVAIAGEEATRTLLNTLGLHTVSGYDVRSQVLALVRERAKPRAFYDDRETITDGDFRRLSQRVEPDLLGRVTKARGLARATSESVEAAEWFFARVRALGVEEGPPAPLLLGRHLLEAGLQPGEQIGVLLRRVYDLQLDDKVRTLEEALAAVTSIDSKTR